MGTLRDKIAAVDDAERELVDVPEWDVKIEIRSPAVQARTRLLASFLKGDGTVEWDALFPALLTITCFDPDTDELVFTDDDVDMLSGKNALVVDRLSVVAARLAGLDMDAQTPGQITDEVIGQGKVG